MHTKFLAGLALAGGLLHAAQPQPLNDGFLTSLRAEAAHSHPSVTAAKLRADAAAQDVRGLRLWDDPMVGLGVICLLYTSPSPRDRTRSRMPSSA